MLPPFILTFKQVGLNRLIKLQVEIVKKNKYDYGLFVILFF